MYRSMRRGTSSEGRGDSFRLCFLHVSKKQRGVKLFAEIDRIIYEMVKD